MMVPYLPEAQDLRQHMLCDSQDRPVSLDQGNQEGGQLPQEVQL